MSAVQTLHYYSLDIESWPARTFTPISRVFCMIFGMVVGMVESSKVDTTWKLPHVFF